MAAPNPPAGTPVYEPMKATDVRPYDPEEALRAAIPTFTNFKKTDYLCYRACGFSLREAASLAGTTQGYVHQWRKQDPVFREWEQVRLVELQRDVSTILLKFQFTRNMHLVLNLDGKLLTKANFSPEGIDALTTEEKKYLIRAADRYKTQELLAMARALQPERDDSDARGTGPNLNVFIGGEHVHGIVEQRAAAKELLKQFSANTEIIDATGVVVPLDEDGYGDPYES